MADNSDILAALASMQEQMVALMTAVVEMRLKLDAMSKAIELDDDDGNDEWISSDDVGTRLKDKKICDGADGDEPCNAELDPSWRYCPNCGKGPWI